LAESLSLCSGDISIIIVDQSDDDSTARALSRYLIDPRFVYIPSDTRGVSAGRNVGISASFSEFLCITDDDCLVDQDWPQRMCEPFADQAIGVIWCSVTARDSGGLTPQKLFRENTVVRDVETAWRRAEAGFNLGAGMAIRRSAFEDAGGFDESLGPGALFPSAEDNDLAWRCLIRGWLVAELATVSVVHDGKREGPEVRALAQRDFAGLGGTLQKYVRARQWGAFRLLAILSMRMGVSKPIRDALSGRRPSGFRTVLWLWGAYWRGRQLRVDPATLRYR